MTSHRTNSFAWRHSLWLCALLLALCPLPLALRAASVWIQWDPATDTNTIGYLVYYGPGQSTNTDGANLSSAGAGLSLVTLTNRLTSRITIGPAVLLTNILVGVPNTYFAVATNRGGLFSPPSEILIRTIPLPPTNSILIEK